MKNPFTRLIALLFLSFVLSLFVNKSHAQYFEWYKSTSGGGTIASMDMVADSNDDIYVVGYYTDVAIFGQGEPNFTRLFPFGGKDIFLAKYASTGELLWVKRAGSASEDWCVTVCVDNADNVYIGGYFMENCVFEKDQPNETSITSEDYFDGYFAKYNADGDFQWVETLSGIGLDYIQGLEIDDNNNIIVIGTYESSMVINKGKIDEQNLSSSGLSDMFVAKFDETKNLLWVKSAVGGNKEGATKIALKNNKKPTAHHNAKAIFNKQDGIV